MRSRKSCDLAAAAAFPAGERDVRVKGAAFGLEADRLASALDLGGERRDRRPWARRRPTKRRSCAARSGRCPRCAARTARARIRPSAAARSSASGRSTSPTKRRVRCSCSSSCQRKSALSSIASISRSRMGSGGRMATNSRCMTRFYGSRAGTGASAEAIFRPSDCRRALARGGALEIAANRSLCKHYNK